MREYLSIQYLRGLAATMVVIYHLATPLKRIGWTYGWPDGFSAGVDIFFVISGLVMWLTTRTRAIGPLRFWWKRIGRIVPLYWLVTTAMLAVLLLAPQLMRTAVYDPRHVLASYAFVPWRNPARPLMEPLAIPGWTLNYEMFFYLIFGLFLLTRPAVRLWGTVALLVSLVVAGRAAGVPLLTIAGFYSGNVVVEFAYGMLLGELVYVRGEGGLCGRRAGMAMVAGGLIVLVAFPEGPLLHAIRFGLPALAVVVGALAVEGRGGVPEMRLPHLLGNASYSIYLTQIISMAAFAAVWHRLHLDAVRAAPFVFAPLDVAFTLTMGCVCYLVVERRLIALVRGDTRRRMPDTAAPAAS